MYAYASYLVDTFGGRSYLLRRDSRTRLLTTYYCILVLDRANDQKMNPNGVDIRPLIASTANDIRSQKGLIYPEAVPGRARTAGRQIPDEGRARNRAHLPRRTRTEVDRRPNSRQEDDRMTLKEHEYIRQTLERYTNCPLEDFCDHILITNFKRYILRFQEKTKAQFSEGNFRIVNAKDLNCTMIDFGIGSPQAALVINCLAYLDNLKSVIMLGMCGGIDDILKTGDFLVPSAAIRGEGTSRHYMPPEFPAIPASSVNLYCIGAVRKLGLTPHCGIVYTTDRRLWEFDEDFVDYLRNRRILAIEMELATLFTVAYRYELPIGSVMLVSDMPLQRRGIKDKKLSEAIYAKLHGHPPRHRHRRRRQAERQLGQGLPQAHLRMVGAPHPSPPPV